MLAEIISIGDELLIGSTINTNAAWIGERLSHIGFEIQRVTTISDSRQAIEQSVQRAMQENNLVLITGGLGPTNDDITKNVLCSMFNSTLQFHEQAYAAIETFLKSRNGTMNEHNKSQAMLPHNALIIPNTCGTASGMWFSKNKCEVISMPGVPFEMTAMMTNYILPRLTQVFELPHIEHHHILLTGIAEAQCAELIAPWENQLPPSVHLAYLPSPGVLKLRLTCTACNAEETHALIAAQETALLPYVREYIFAYDNETLEENIGKLLTAQGASVATAESCTGGAVAQSITSIAGCSTYFKGSVVAYANEVKQNILRVPQQILETHGAVSQQCVETMAQNCRTLFNTTYAIATSGIAGPGGGSAEKPVGTVWIAVATPTHVISQKFAFGDNRQRIVQRSVIAALRMVQQEISKNGDVIN